KLKGVLHETSSRIATCNVVVTVVGLQHVKFLG
ncbi:MAG: hypothetical protein ACI843_002357, partial [Psychrobacter glaciei]